MSVTDGFRALADRIVDDLLEADPVSATWLGDHRFDDRLADLSPDGVDAQLRAIDDHVTALDAVDDVELGVEDLVDLEILRARLLRAQFELGEVRRHEWDPMVWNPGTALHLLVSREFAAAEERGAALRARLAAIPDLLSAARGQLAEMSEIHLETAVAQLDGTRELILTDVRALAGDDHVVEAAAAEVDAFAEWLRERQMHATRDPRLGERLYAAALWHALDDGTPADELMADAQAHLAHVGEQLELTARAYLGAGCPDDPTETIRTALADVARAHPVTDATVLPLMQQAIDGADEFVRAQDLVTMPDVRTRLIDMPAIHRGVAVAYCDAPGPLERADVATYVAVAPTPPGWDDERVASFYREYNGMQLHDLAIHEAMSLSSKPRPMSSWQRT